LLYTGKEIENVVTDLLKYMAATIRSQRTGIPKTLVTTTTSVNKMAYTDNTKASGAACLSVSSWWTL